MKIGSEEQFRYGCVCVCDVGEVCVCCREGQVRIQFSMGEFIFGFEGGEICFLIFQWFGIFVVWVRCLGNFFLEFLEVKKEGLGVMDFRRS